MEDKKIITLGDFKVMSIVEDTTEIPKGVSMIKAPEYWNKGDRGRGVVIAVIDSGCDCDHVDLKDRIIGKYNFTSDDGGNPEIVTDYIGHGTHVAGIIGASQNGKGVVGVAPLCSLLILKALNKNGQGTEEAVAKAINYAVSKKVNIISMSLGSTEETPLIYQAIKKAVSNNILVVCAAGNEGDSNGDTEELSYPAVYSECISVGAVDYSKNIARFTNSNKSVDLVAPGVSIMSTYPNNKYANLQGTSMATPHVSGALALIINWSRKDFGREMSETELYAQLIRHTASLGFKKTLVGNGLLYLLAPQILENYISQALILKL